METKSKQKNPVEIASRLKTQVADLEAAVTAAKREAVRLFKELDGQMKTARDLAGRLDGKDGEWARSVSSLMDILGECSGTMEGMLAIGLLRQRLGFSWTVERIFDA